ncbi:DUF3047 domain-containing protein [Methylosinus sporium]|uniref:DUF3047 domain-containing protein n=1 Tax=Methylosinus sporium TaxID=428 RepID=A0A2U1SN46_METSR|nr:DUF3047 domain-containing protein [Methylosinus sporium]PWB93029.1 hypothetical protein C5689_15240 [Methylosinus sporium]
MCLYCLARASAALSRRDMLRMGALGAAALPFVASPATAESADLVRDDFKRDMEALIARARSGALVSYRLFEIDGDDLPWIDLGLAAAKGQQVSFLVAGRMWIARPYDLWFKPGLVFHARTRGKRPIYSPGVDTGTMIAAHDGPLEIARSAAQFADADGRLWTPEAEYRKQEVKIVGVALVWKGEALSGLESLAAAGDVNGLVAAEIARLKAGHKLPEGWNDLFSLGGGAEVFGREANGEIVCESAGSASIIERPLPLAFASRPKLGWRWKIDQLPSAKAEDVAPFHDYLSIGVKFEDGQDLTYFWSAGLPTGKVFRCPLAGWSAVETHMVVDSGAAGLGEWRALERDVAADYAAHIGGPAKAISHIWLLAITPFQRRRGACRYADIRVATADGAVTRL